jgi:RNA polymerase sigma factor (sigma-70 family)
LRAIYKFLLRVRLFLSLTIQRMTEEIQKGFLKAHQDYSEAIYRHCFFRVFSKTRAEELVQETFMRVWQYLVQGKTVDNMRAFLYRVANNLIIDESRKKKEESLEVIMEKSPGYEPFYEGHKAIEKQIMYKEIVEGMKDLPSDYKEILILRYIEDLDPKEIAEILETNANNVSVKINRAVKALKGKFALIPESEDK